MNEQEKYRERLLKTGIGPDWKSPDDWTEAEVHTLVMKEVGVDESFPRGFRVLLKLWEFPEMVNGIFQAENHRANQMVLVGKILRMGQDAFQCRARYPSGPTYTYGEWVQFRPMEDRKFRKCGHLLAEISDERLQAVDLDPSTLKSALILEEEYKQTGE